MTDETHALPLLMMLVLLPYCTYPYILYSTHDLIHISRPMIRFCMVGYTEVLALSFVMHLEELESVSAIARITHRFLSLEGITHIVRGSS